MEIMSANENEGYRSFQEYWNDNQVDQCGEIRSTVSPGFNGTVLVSIHWTVGAVENVVMPNVKEATDLANLAVSPLFGGSKLACLCETELPVTCYSAQEWASKN